MRSPEPVAWIEPQAKSGFQTGGLNGSLFVLVLRANVLHAMPLRRRVPDLVR
jgi:hypothetical protein